MKKKELLDLRAKSTKDLAAKINELEKEITTAQLELKMGKLKNVHLPRQKRKDLARLKTVMRLKILTLKVESSKQDVEEAANAAN